MPVTATTRSNTNVVRGNPPAAPVTNVAGFGTAIGNAAALAAGINIVSGGNNTVGVILPVCQPGLEVEVYSSVAASGLKVYPQVNSTINGGTANAALVIEGQTLARFVGLTDTNWGTIYTANS